MGITPIKSLINLECASSSLVSLNKFLFLSDFPLQPTLFGEAKTARATLSVVECRMEVTTETTNELRSIDGLVVNVNAMPAISMKHH